MLQVIDLLLDLAAFLVLIPALTLFIEVIAARPAGPRRGSSLGPRPRMAVLMPAHNEAAVIATTLRTVLPQLVEGDRLLVVADNCSDETVAVATAEGAEVIVRANLAQRGKGYALDYGMRHLASDAPEVAVIIDADCQIAEGCLDELGRRCNQLQRPIQALYLMQSPAGASAITRVSEFAWALINYVRPAGLLRLGLPCQLNGSGMAFPWARLSAIDMANANLVEDRQIGLDLARNGCAPLFCAEALVVSQFPPTREGRRRQRTRWEHGSMTNYLHGPALIVRALATSNFDLVAMGFDLSIAPVALLLMQTLIVWCLSVAGYVETRSLFAPAASTAAGLALIGSVTIAWRRFGRNILPGRMFGMAMLYMLGKVPLYVKYVFARQFEWVRSQREEAEPPVQRDDRL